MSYGKRIFKEIKNKNNGACCGFIYYSSYYFQIDGRQNSEPKQQFDR